MGNIQELFIMLYDAITVSLRLQRYCNFKFSVCTKNLISSII